MTVPSVVANAQIGHNGGPSFGRAIVFDIETDGFLHQMSRVHVVCLRIIEDGVASQVFRYRESEMEDALAVLSSADTIIGHNIVSFDLPALEQTYPHWQLPETVVVRDTMVMARMCFANIKDNDFRLHEKGLISGALIGTHGLEAWGQRLGEWKGDYLKVKIEEAKAAGITDPDDVRKFVWGEWNQPMEDYCVQDVEVTTKLWQKIVAANWADTATRLEHRVHHAMFMQEQFGFEFNAETAQALAAEVRVDYDKLRMETIAHFGTWVAPKKMYRGEPRRDFGEDDSRKAWAEITVPKRSVKYADVRRGEYTKDAPYCAVVTKEFNPNSRPQIRDRLEKIYQWEPVDFTEAGNAVLDDDVLKNLTPHIPICENLAELFFLKKLLGALEDGDNAWLGMVRDGRIHGYVNTGGTVSGRASHLSPNMAQVPKVVVVDVLTPEGSDVVKAGGELLPEHFNKKVRGKDGKPIPDCFDEQGIRKKKIVLKGRRGKYGWECRSLFTAPAGWVLMGCDLSGIELRCLAARLAAYDGGEYVNEVLNGDPHTKNQFAFGVDSRDTAKTCLYAIMYGGGDLKIGSIVLPPSATAGQMRARGKQLKANLQKGIPAFGKLMKQIARDAARGYMLGLDGRKLFVRSKHSALNLQLQSDAALIAKLWVVYFTDMMADEGYVFGVDWGLCAWVHDEIQAACRTREIADRAAELCKEAAKLAGEFFDYRAPVGAEAKIGKTWAETH
jgi:hypothetical protein